MRFMVMRLRTALLAAAVALAALLFAVRGIGRVVQTAAQPQKHPIYSVATDEARVSLGINCAWGDEDIPALLAVLEEKDVRATFFVVGDWCEKYPDAVRAIAAAGHEIGSHSDTHADMSTLDEAGILREIRDSVAKIEAVTGAPPTLLRPPSGAYNETVVALIESEGLYPIQWDCDSVDYRNPTPAQMIERIFKTLKNGSILLFHAGTENTATALPQVIEAIRAEGYEFVSVGELVHPRPYTVDFEGRQHPAPAADS